MSGQNGRATIPSPSVILASMRMRSPELNETRRAHGLVGGDDLELVAGLLGHEQLQLQRPGLTLADDRADTDEAGGTGPGLGRPRQLGVGQVGANPAPAPALLDELLELDEALEGHREGELDARGLQGRDHGLTEEGAIEAHLQLGVGANRPGVGHAGGDEGLGAAGVMHIARPVQDVEDLAGLRQGAEQG